MATVDEIFATIDGEEPHIVVNPDRSITVPDELINIAVQYDHNIEHITFDCPRYWDGYDLSEMNLYINYTSPKGYLGVHECTDITIDSEDDSIIHFVWTILNRVTDMPGTIKFLVCAQKVNDDSEITQIWHTKVCDQCSISPGIPCGNTTDDQHMVIPDNYDFQEQFDRHIDLMKTLIADLLNYDYDKNGVIDSAQTVNGWSFNKDDNGIYIEELDIDNGNVVFPSMVQTLSASDDGEGNVVVDLSGGVEL